MNLSGDYNRELLGEEITELLRNTRFLIAGLGGLGSFVATELAYLGAKNLILVDNDRVSRSNLNRQILYGQRDIGKAKVFAAAKRLKELFPDINVEAFDTRISKANGSYLVEKADIVIDCTDNFESKKLLNLLCFSKKRALISAGVGSWEGWVATFPFFKEEDIPCLECLFPGDLETLKELGSGNMPTIVTTVGTIGTIQVQEVVKLLTQKGENLEGKTLIVDLKNYQCVPVKLNKNPNCPVCSPRSSPR